PILACHYVTVHLPLSLQRAICADLSNHTPLHYRSRPLGIMRNHVEHLLTFTSVGESFVLWNNEASPLCACNNEFAPTLMAESSYEIGLLLQVYKQPDRLTMAAASGKLGGIERVEAAIAGEHHAPRGCLCRECEFRAVIRLECDARLIAH